MGTKAKRDAKAMGRTPRENNEGNDLRKFQSPYNHFFAPEKCYLRLKNDHFLKISY